MTFDITKVCYEPKKELLGTKVYYHNRLNLLDTVVTEENGVYSGVIDKVDETEDNTMPFRVSGIWCSLVYPVEEPKGGSLPKYRPFNNVDELVSRWDSINPCTRPANTMPLIWVKHKESETVELITAFCKDGVETSAEYRTWGTLFDTMVFLDNSPCGVEIC